MMRVKMSQSIDKYCQIRSSNKINLFIIILERKTETKKNIKLLFHFLRFACRNSFYNIYIDEVSIYDYIFLFLVKKKTMYFLLFIFFLNTSKLILCVYLCSRPTNRLFFQIKRVF